MLALSIHLAAAIRGYMAYYMPTNRAVDWLRTPRGLKWAIPVALVATPAYLFAMSICVATIERGGPGYLNVLVMLFAWNALKFAVMGAVGLPMILWRAVASGRTASRVLSLPGMAALSRFSWSRPHSVDLEWRRAGALSCLCEVRTTSCRCVGAPR